MNTAVLLLGSPKAKGSASRVVGEAMLTRLAARGWDVRTERIPTAMDDDAKAAAVLDAAAPADLVVLAFPLYVDTLPALVTRFLERWADSGGSLRGGQRLAVLVQCGFPEAAHCAPAIEVCRHFAEEAGLEWAGAIAFGMAGSLASGSLERSPYARALPALDEAADALAAGEGIPASAVAAFATPPMPRWLYTLIGNVGWRIEARKQSADASLRVKRYAQ